MGYHYFRFTLILTLLAFTSSSHVKPETQGCSLEGIDLQHCLYPGTKTSISMDSCCTALNEVAQAGYHCLCSLLDSSKYSSLSTAIAFSFSCCYISVPPLTHCHGLEANPEIAAPPLNQPPPPSPELPVLVSPNLPRKSSSVPLPSKANEVSLNSECNNSPEDSAKIKILLNAGILLMFVLYAYNA